MAKKQASSQSADSGPQSKLTPIGKITVASVYGKPLTKNIPEDGELPLMKVAGYVTGVKHGESNYGPWAALTGQFAATNLETGEVFMSKTGIIPGTMGDALVDTVTEKLAEDAEAQVAFRVIVSCKVSPRDANKYEYIVRPELETEFKSPALALLTQ